jgi:hypothetical protein
MSRSRDGVVAPRFFLTPRHLGGADLRYGFLLRVQGHLRHRHGVKAQEGEGVVIGGDPVAALDATAIAAMNHHLLAIGPEGDANRRHQGTAGTGTIAWPPQVDVARGKAQRTVVAVPSPRDGCADESATAPAFEWLALVGTGARAEGQIAPVFARFCANPVCARFCPV